MPSTGHSCHGKCSATKRWLQLHPSAYNLATVLRCIELVKIGARAVTFQRAEVMVTRLTASTAAMHMTVIGSQTIGKRQEICLRRGKGLSEQR